MPSHSLAAAIDTRGERAVPPSEEGTGRSVTIEVGAAP